MGRLRDRIAVVTGAGRGIGREIALLMSAGGAKVVVNDLGANTDSVADVAGGERLVQTAMDAFGGMDILVFNAGILRDRTIFKMEETDWDSVLAVHLKGLYCCTRPFANYIRAENRIGCRIINFSSVSGLFGNFGQAKYGAAKAGIAGFSWVIALELAKYGCTSNTISPGALTRMTIPLRQNRGETVEESDIEAGGPQHIAPICTWLASEESAGITSKIFHAARGGITIMQQPRIIKQFKKSEGLWSLDELDGIVPQLMEAKKANMEAADESAKPIVD